MKKYFIIIVMLFIMFFDSSIGYANNSYCTRYYSMGGACVGLASDYNAVFCNPAGLAHNNLIGINFGLTRIFNKHKVPSSVLENINWQALKTDIAKDEMFLGNYGSVSGLKVGSLGIAYSEIAFGDISEDNSTFATGVEKSFNLAYARPILKPFANIGALSWGINLRHFTKSNTTYSIENLEYGSLQTVDNAVGNAIDLGVMVRTANIINFGLKVDNIISKVRWQESGLVKVPQTITAGLAVNVPVLNMTVATDISKTKSIPGTCLKMGLEKQIFFGALALRAGFTRDNQEDILYTGGLGLNLGPFKADLGFGIDDATKKNITSLIGLKIDF